ncbi:Zn-ribbon domain-containing OB-fold protein [Novosphingobium album (ex Liu et al. 2023)]|uniref:Zinc ribbon domain-containing protein n=1 Tax=Novosphingobium album (ex Liu et al. 2023) TaxID=3031130 RepID=A0ABT5WUL5_9SPHN|nr:zinc ribbon domain-containing protein [Novosphingobium album (ex Liu et al. 2023)]MDE8653561.1 zinc ribbon domain-containing protein [Novosphingobium album (ex Liu et al. 2023)]
MRPVAALNDHEVFDRYPDELIDHDNIDHYRAMAERRLVIRHCQDCGYWIYPHRPICPECLSENLRFEEVSGRGTIFMETRLHQLRDPDASIVEPIVAAAVELEERTGLRYLSRIVNCRIEDIVLDMPVSLTWIEEDGCIWPAFEPAAG